MARWVTLNTRPSGIVRVSVEDWRVVSGTGEAVTYENSWAAETTAGRSGARFYRDPFGVVWIDGAVEHAGVAAASTIFTLPKGYRPEYETLWGQWGSIGGVNDIAQVVITAAGAVRYGAKGNDHAAGAQAVATLTLQIAFRVPEGTAEQRWPAG